MKFSLTFWTHFPHARLLLVACRNTLTFQITLLSYRVDKKRLRENLVSSAWGWLTEVGLTGMLDKYYAVFPPKNNQN